MVEVWNHQQTLMKSSPYYGGTNPSQSLPQPQPQPCSSSLLFQIPMELSRENPRPLPFPATKPMPIADLAPKPPPPPTPIVDRYKALLKQRDDDLRVSPDDDVSPPSTEENVQLYELLLSELVFNSKPIITDLTIIAGEQRDHGKGIGDAI